MAPFPPLSVFENSDGSIESEVFQKNTLVQVESVHSRSRWKNWMLYFVGKWVGTFRKFNNSCAISISSMSGPQDDMFQQV